MVLISVHNKYFCPRSSHLAFLGKHGNSDLQLSSTMESTGRIYLLHSFKQLILELQLIETVSWKTVLILRYFCRFRYLAYLASFLYTETVLLCLLYPAFTLAVHRIGMTMNSEFRFHNFQPTNDTYVYLQKTHTFES